MRFGIRAALLGQRKPPTPPAKSRLGESVLGLAQAQTLPSAPRSPRAAAAPAAAAPDAKRKQAV